MSRLGEWAAALAGEGSLTAGGSAGMPVMAVVRRGCGGGRKCAAVGASDDLGRAASHRGVGETTAVGDLAAVPDGSTTSLAILVSALTAAPAARPS